MTVKVGDKIRVIDANPYGIHRYVNGEIYYVSNVWGNGEGVDIGNDADHSVIEMYNREFEVVPPNPHAELFAEPMGNEVGAVNTPVGKQLRIYTATDVDGDFLTHVTVGIDEATGVMYVLGMKTEVSE